MTKNWNNITDNLKEILSNDKEFQDGLIQIRQIDETGEKIMIGIGGKAAVPYIFNGRKEAEEYIKKKPWSLIFALIAAMMDANNKVIQQIKENGTNNAESGNNAPAE